MPKGEYELDVCIVLSGNVDLLDEGPDGGRVRVAGVEAGNFYGELGAIGGLPRTADCVAGARGTDPSNRIELIARRPIAKCMRHENGFPLAADVERIGLCDLEAQATLIVALHSYSLDLRRLEPLENLPQDRFLRG